MMDEHVRIGRKYPIDTIEHNVLVRARRSGVIVAFEGDPGKFLDLVMQLRESEASSYTLRRYTDTHACCRCRSGTCSTPWRGQCGAGSGPPPARAGLHARRTLSELPPGSAKRVYAATSRCALQCERTVHAVANRCTHARASLSEGTVDAARCTVTAPGTRACSRLRPGRVLGGPPAIPSRRIK